MKTWQIPAVHPKVRLEIKYWEAWHCGVLIDQNNSIAILRHKWRFSPGVIFKAIR